MTDFNGLLLLTHDSLDKLRDFNNNFCNVLGLVPVRELIRAEPAVSQELTISFHLQGWKIQRSPISHLSGLHIVSNLLSFPSLLCTLLSSGCGSQHIDDIQYVIYCTFSLRSPHVV